VGVKGRQGMTNSKIDEGFYKSKYENLAKALTERDLKIVELQRELSVFRDQMEEVDLFRNLLHYGQKFFGLMLSQRQKLN
jgi:hypothetical protein